MTKNQLKDLVKSYFSLTEKMTEDNTTEPIKFAEATLADGTKISNKKDAEFAVGDKLYVIIDGGEDVIAPEGEHTTESGITVTVNEAGDITGIKRPDSAGEGSLEDFSKETETKEVESTELAEHGDEIIIEEEAMEEDESIDRGAIIEAIMEEMAPKIEDLEKKMSSCMDRLAEHDQKMKEYMSEPAKSPAMEKKFSTNKVDDANLTNMSAANKRAYRRLLTKTKN
jgi:hypothetical protein